LTFYSIILNHPFIDGNKRSGMVSGLVFLELYGLKVKVNQKELVNASLNITSKKWNIEHIAHWLEMYSKTKTFNFNS
jgi:death on curing protein